MIGLLTFHHKKTKEDRVVVVDVDGNWDSLMRVTKYYFNNWPNHSLVSIEKLGEPIKFDANGQPREDESGD